jgi:hypothetical protein
MRKKILRAVSFLLTIKSIEKKNNNFHNKFHHTRNRRKDSIGTNDGIGIITYQKEGRICYLNSVGMIKSICFIM